MLSLKGAVSLLLLQLVLLPPTSTCAHFNPPRSALPPARCWRRPSVIRWAQSAAQLLVGWDTSVFLSTWETQRRLSSSQRESRGQGRVNNHKAALFGCTSSEQEAVRPKTMCLMHTGKFHPCRECSLFWIAVVFCLKLPPRKSQRCHFCSFSTE